MSNTQYPNNCLQQSILPQLSKLIAQPQKSKSFKAVHSQRIFSHLKSKPLIQFHDTYREAFKARVFNPEQEYSSMGILKPIHKELFAGNKLKKAKYAHIDKTVTNRIGFIYSSLKLIEQHIVDNVKDPKLLNRIKQIFGFLEALTQDISKNVAEKLHKIHTIEQQNTQLNVTLNSLKQENSQLHEYNQTLIKYEKGVNQLKLSHENDKLGLEIEQLTRVLICKERTIEQLNEQLDLAHQKNDQFDNYKATIDIKMNKLKEQLQLSQHTRQQNLAIKMKYLLSSE